MGFEALTDSVVVDCHRRAGVLRRWDRHVAERRREAEGRTMGRQHRTTVWEAIDIAVLAFRQKEEAEDGRQLVPFSNQFPIFLIHM